MIRLSAIITTFNEEEHIRPLLENLSWVDEIIVVDSFSTDQTVAIAREFTSQVLQRPYLSPADQKNWAIPRASHEWILLLDADERVTPELKKEIQSWLARDEIPWDAFWIPRQSFFMGRRVRYSGWQGDKVVRFFRRDVCRYNDNQVHEEIITDGIRVSRLKHPLQHFTFKDTRHFVSKVQRYAIWSAEDHLKKTPRVTWFHLFVKPAFRVFRHFLFKGGFLDGKTGFIISSIMAWGVFLRYVRIMEIRQMQKGENGGVRSEM